MPAIIPAVIVGAGAIGGALISSNATSNAANTAAGAAAQDNALQSQIYQSNKTLEQPYITAGNTAENELSGFLGLGGDPAATQSALNTYLNSTGYQFNLNQGLEGVAADKAVSGELNSGAAAKALDAYGTGLANSYGQQYAGNLQSMVGTGAGAANALSNTGAAYADASNSNTNSAARTTANADLANAANANSAIGNAMKAYGTLSGTSSFGGSGSGSAATASYMNAFEPGGA